MDAHTLGLLQFDKIRELIAGYATSELGKERARGLAPLDDADRIRLSIARISEMADALAARLPPPLGGLRDVRGWVHRAELGILLEIEPLLEIRDLLDLTGRAYEYWLRLGADYPKLELLLSDIEDLRPIARSIEAAIDSQGKVRDDATPELAEVRAQLAELDRRIQVELKRLLRQPEIRKALRFPQATLSGDHHVLPVAINYRQAVAGVVHRASATGETIYIEPAKVAEISAEATVLRITESREVRRVLRRLTTLIAGETKKIRQAIDILAEVDFLFAAASYSRDYSMSPPTISDGRRLRLRDARHPILEWMRKPSPESVTPNEAGPVVPISVELGSDIDLLVVTGPNTGGKTVTLKTVGLLSAMALSGLHVPAGLGSEAPLLADILADIGDEQSIEQSLSTFSAHVSRIAEILRRANPGTLVLLDELGAGTDPSEGAALGRAILDELIRSGALAMVTTHLGDLKLFALKAPRAENAAAEFDPQTLRPTYRLLIGQFGKSCALKIARRLKLPRPLIARAERYLRRGRRGGAGLDSLMELREQARAAKEEATKAEAVAEEAAKDFQRRSDLLEQEAAVRDEIEKFRANLKPGEKVRVVRFDKTGVIVRVDPRRRQAAVTVGAVEWRLSFDELLPLPRES